MATFTTDAIPTLPDIHNAQPSELQLLRELTAINFPMLTSSTEVEIQSLRESVYRLVEDAGHYDVNAMYELDMSKLGFDRPNFRRANNVIYPLLKAIHTADIHLVKYLLEHGAKLHFSPMRMKNGDIVTVNVIDDAKHFSDRVVYNATVIAFDSEERDMHLQIWKRSLEIVALLEEASLKKTLF